MISWTWRIGSASSSLPSVKTTSWRVVASVGIGFLRENWKCAPVIGPGGRLLSASGLLSARSAGRFIGRWQPASARLPERAVRTAPAPRAGGLQRAAERLEREAQRGQRDRPGRSGGRLDEPRAREL